MVSVGDFALKLELLKTCFGEQCLAEVGNKKAAMKSVM